MRWAHRLSSQVSSGVRSRGSRYYSSGNVHIQRGSATHVEAAVQGSIPYSVKVRIDDRKVVVMCDCPYFDTEGTCKHIWATLLAAEADGYLHRVASMWTPFIVAGNVGAESEDDEDDNDDEDEDFGEYDFVSGAGSQPAKSIPRAKRRSGTPKPKPLQLPEWKRQLLDLRKQSPAIRATAPAEGSPRIIYVVDVQDCLQHGGVIVQAAASRKKSNGDWGKPGFQDRWIRTISNLDPVDRQIFALLGGATDTYQSSNSTSPTRRRLAPDSYNVMLPLLSSTDRFFVRLPADRNELLPLRWDDAEPWQFRVRMDKADDTEHYSVNGYLRRDMVERPLSDAALLAPGVVVFTDSVARFDDANAFDWVRFFRQKGSLNVPASHGGEFAAEIAQFPALPPMEMPEEFRIEDGVLSGPHELRIKALKNSGQYYEKHPCEVMFVYGTLKVPEAVASTAVKDTSTGKYLRRDTVSETAAMERLVDLGLQRLDSWQGKEWSVTAARLPLMVRTLVAEGWHVEAEGRKYRRSGSFSLNVVSGIDWFDIQGAAEFDGQSVELPELLRAAARGENMVRLGDGTFGLLPDEWLERYRRIAGFGKIEDGGLRFKRSQAGLLDALLASQPEVSFDEGFQKVRRELETFAGVGAHEAPPTFRGQLRDYQREGLGWLRFLRRFGFGGCLADDMGLGKTIQVLSLLDSDERKGPALIVVPRSLIFNWKEEAARFTPRLRVLDFTGIGRKDRWNLIADHDIVLTTYGTLRRDAPILKDTHFDTIVLDEAQAIKNASTESAKATRLLNGEHRLALTGTPVENSLTDLWSLFEFLNPGLLGNAAIFKSQTAADPTGDSAALLSKALRPFILRRTKDQVAKELPSKTEQTIYCELEGPQRKLYIELREHYRASLLGHIERDGIRKSKMHILEALLRLRQAACHPGLIDKKKVENSSAKLDALLPQLREVIAEGHKALVFSQFTSFLSILRKKLDDEGIVYEYLDGKTRVRESRVRRFQEDPLCPLFLISLKAGGLGLNLTAAEYVFLLDPWWNPAAEAQAIDRSHRIGQSRRVFAYRLIAKDTVEEKVLELQKSKRDLADSILTPENSVLAGLDRETLEMLLS
jgi:superfamily II DNA or RNA helicase